jgi:site-specific DNA-methyltransferase (adenine-specific)
MLRSNLKTPDLFAEQRPEKETQPEPGTAQKQLGQYFTPEWAAEDLVAEFFPELGPDHFVIEPSCGPGPFLKALPANIPALGIEIDPALAEYARQNTGKEIICSDFLSAEISRQPTHFLGNPPFEADLFEKFLTRMHSLLPKNGRCGFIIPAYFTQTSNRFLRWNEQWGMQQYSVPRELFEGLSIPIQFCLFEKAKARSSIGFKLYHQSNDIRKLTKNARVLLTTGKKNTPVWDAVLEYCFEQVGGEATLEELYRVAAPRVPLTNNTPKEKIRQTLARGENRRYARVERGRWRQITLVA